MKYTYKNFTEASLWKSITSVKDVIFIIKKMSMSYHTFTVKITLSCFLFRFVLHRSMAIKTEQDSSVKQSILVPVSKILKLSKLGTY